MRKTVLTSLVYTFFFMSASLAQNEDFNLNLKSHTPFAVELSDIWGYVDEEGNEYAIIGRHNGVSIYDVTNAANPNEVFSAPGLNSTWRDIKTFGDYAYVTCECWGGLLIIDMSPLPFNSNLSYAYWTPADTMQFQKAHNLYIDEDGYAYIFGADYANGGAIILDLNADPMDPTPVGLFNNNYLHDGVVSDNKLWAGAVNIGEAQAIDVSDKTNPILLSSWKTPNAFTHNMWISDDNKYLFTTDEKRNGRIGAYDVSNVLNPTRLDVWAPADTGIIPHNTHFINDYLVTSHYTIGLNILDVKRPNNMVEVARYDTSPDYNYEGFHGCWGVYPWLPSGNIIASDIEKGLYVFEPNYVRGCYLEGSVTDEQTGGVIFFPTIKIVEETSVTEGSIIGEYAISTLNAGTYTVEVSAEDYYSKTIQSVSLTNGQLTTLDVTLSKWPTGLSEQTAATVTSMYPNPAQSITRIASKFSIEAVNIRGANGALIIVDQFRIDDRQIDLNIETLQSGVYTVQVFTDDGLSNHRLIVL